MLNILDSKNIIDTHCHLNDTSFDSDREEVVHRAIEVGIPAIVDIAVDVETSKKSLKNAETFPGIVFPSAGIDPEVFVPGSDFFDESLFTGSQMKIGKWINKSVADIDNLLKSGKFVMVGECGMDFYWLERNKNLSQEDKKKSKIMQKLLFSSQIELALKYSLPLSIHSRGAEDECIEIIESFKSQAKEKGSLVGSFHSFTGSVEQANRIVKLGFKIGVNGIVTYKGAQNVRDIVCSVGRENVVLETDAPYLVPAGVKVLVEKRNEPASVVEVDKYLSELI